MAKGKGWDATGRIEAVWKQLQTGKRDELADLSGVLATELSSHNNGKPLGRTVAQKILDGAAKGGVVVSVLELGAPVEEADEAGLTLLTLLQGLRATVEAQQATIDTQAGSIRRLQARVRALERRGVNPGRAREGG